MHGFQDSVTLRTRCRRHKTVEDALARLSDQQLRDLVEEAPVIGSGIGGATSLVHIKDTPVFVKHVPLTDLELRPENVRSTSNLFDLPTCCQYGVGSPSFGAWRELEANILATDQVRAGHSENFVLMYHWRVLDGPSSTRPLSAELADVDRTVEYWHGSAAVRRRLEAINRSSSTLALFLEYVPQTLPQWLEKQMAAGTAATDAAIAMVEHNLLTGVAFMNKAGLFHFDAHFDNILTDGEQLFFADFGLATSPYFALSSAELSFLDANLSHDLCHTLTRLVDWLVTASTDVPNWEARNDFIRRCAQDSERADHLMPSTAAIIKRYAPIAAVINGFYRKLHLEDRATLYPTGDVHRVCAAMGLEILL